MGQRLASDPADGGQPPRDSRPQAPAAAGLQRGDPALVLLSGPAGVAGHTPEPRPAGDRPDPGRGRCPADGRHAVLPVPAAARPLAERPLPHSPPARALPLDLPAADLRRRDRHRPGPPAPVPGHPEGREPPASIRPRSRTAAAPGAAARPAAAGAPEPGALEPGTPGGCPCRSRRRPWG